MPLSIDHALNTLNQLDGITPRIAQESQFIAIGAVINFAVQRCADADQALTRRLHVVHRKSQVESYRVMGGVIDDFAQRITVDFDQALARAIGQEVDIGRLVK